ncbi:pyridoxamine 5'-phosphate oxidase [Oleiphilus sp. HI0071]|jgi:hypothetical protein|uniref:pyridoxamine 5'-phosphate oxidase family protein n=1 Tax=Oleiphilus sp. HI0080 TaxID=1822255 RepID=UPI0007C3888F|nr:pyridoxamine 5'-phosphate oxidase family protein [Oleiphilus sp. HI0080]KZY60084.1 pyridoxamine 5'-phosphate oxidase [Oleiphilus sp. HI0065]KZY84289.1 pyridoxamine 5'-phosphate oxidase [Oleiphilus sp. HI0071]KZY95667.1 pyridoxamine 5'-phosphate oxidase [Oleiphilus sp. HI0073]KZZ50007.1 pyridoxamine 5'-phosphate oxidase [Oleiphilus sp. HI0122]KZZ02391.1 pyridoxamine 5'-phosphate oxidase [Oleiphilus sp. HI0073]
MELAKHWNEITNVIGSSQRSSMHCSIATVDDQGMPNVTPIGTVFLRNDFTGYFFDTYTSKLATNLNHSDKACLSAVNTKSSFWLKSLFKGKFLSPPGVRLYGTVGQLREATKEEIAAVNKRIKPLAWSKGSKLIWSSFTHVRDIKFNDFRPVQYPKMMEHLWQ